MLVNGRPLNVFSTHLDPSSSSTRVYEVGTMKNCATNWAEARVIGGDFNMQAASTEYNAMTTAYGDAWPQAKALGTALNYSGNCDGCTRNSRIDYVFVSKAATWLVVKSAQVYDTRSSTGVMPSDHKPMLVEYEVR